MEVTHRQMTLLQKQSSKQTLAYIEKIFFWMCWLWTCTLNVFCVLLDETNTDAQNNMFLKTSACWIVQVYLRIDRVLCSSTVSCIIRILFEINTLHLLIYRNVLSSTLQRPSCHSSPEPYKTEISQILFCNFYGLKVSNLIGDENSEQHNPSTLGISCAKHLWA